MEYLLESEYSDSFFINNNSYPLSIIPISDGDYILFDLSFIDNHIDKYDLVFRAIVRLTQFNIATSKFKDIKLFYFDNDGITKIYVDYGYEYYSNYIFFNITDFLFAKKYTSKTLYIENATGSQISLSSQNDNYIDVLFYKKDQLYSNSNVITDSIFDYQYSYNLFSQQLLFSKTILDKQLFYNLSFVYSSVSKDYNHLFFPKGWNFNVLEYLLFEDGEPIIYVNQNNQPCELVKLDGPSDDYYYTNNGSALILLKEVNSGITTYKLFNEISSSFKRFNADGKIIYYEDNIGNYFNVTYTSTEITITDSKGNVVLIEQESIPNEFRIYLNNNCIGYFTKNTTYNILESISEDGYHNDTFYYLYGNLYEIYINEYYAFEFDTFGVSVKRIIKSYDEEVLDLKQFQYEFLRTLVTDRHGVVTYYEADEYINQTSTGEYSDDYIPKFSVYNQKLIGESIGTIASGLSMKMKTYDGSNSLCNLNTNSDSDEIQFWNDDNTTIFAGQTYAIMATLEKNSVVIFNEDRRVRISFSGGYNSNHVTLIFNKFLRKQTAIKIFKADYTESISNCRAIVYAYGLKSFGGAKISNVCLVEIKNEANSTFWANKLSNDGVYVPATGLKTIDSLDWVQFDYSSLDDPNPNSEQYYEYTYRDLVRNYINVEKNLPFFWDFDHRRLLFRINGNTTGGFIIKDKTNLPGSNTIYARKTIKKVVDINNSSVPLYDFEYLKCAIDPVDNQKKFYQYNLKCLGSETYKTIKVYDFNFNLLSEEDTELNLKNENTYSNGKITESKIEDLSSTNLLFLNKKEITYDNKNRVSSTSSLVQSTFGENEFDYLNNYELVSKSTTPSGIETDFTYSSDLKHNTKIQINTLYNQSTYSNGLVSTRSTNLSTYSYSVGQYGYNTIFTFPNNSTQTSILELGNSNDLVGYFADSILTKIVKSFNKYGKIEYIAEKGPMSNDYTTKATFLYFDNKPNGISTITTQNVEIKSHFKLYKIIDSYINQRIYFDYDNDNRIIDYKITNNSNAQLYKLSYSYDSFDRLSNKIFAINSSNKITETYAYQLPFANNVEDTTFVVNGLVLIGNTIHESITRNSLNQIDEIHHYNDAARLYFSDFKMKLVYNSITNQNTTYQNDLIKRVDYYIAEMTGVFNWNCVYNRSEHIAYDADGNIASIKYGNQSSPSSNTGVEYEYDDYGRLVVETNYDLGISFAYSYDANGNMTSVVKAYMNGSPSETISYGYNSSYPDKLVRINSQTNNIQYDTDLNIRKINNDTFFWARGRLLASAMVNSTSISFSYNYDGTRVTKNSVTGDHTYFLEGHRILGEKIVKDNNTSYITYLYGQNGVFGMTYNNTFYFFQKNLLGDITRIYSGSSLIAKYIYDAFGNFKVLNSSGNEITDQTHVAHINPFRYRGYYYDIETGLYYCNSRYYSPYLRRWISPDRYQYLDFDHIGGLNLYAYCRNNPVMYRDEEGKSVVLLGLFFAAIGISFAVGFAASIVSQGIEYGWENLSWKSALQATVDGIFSSAFTALSFTGLGLLGTVITSGSLSIAQYSIDCQFHKDEFSWQGLVSSGAIGLVSGAFLKHNISVSNMLNSLFSRSFIEPIKVSVGFIVKSALEVLKSEMIENAFENGIENILENFG